MLYYTPWGPQRASAETLERHCARCRVLGLPYETPPQKVAQAAQDYDKAELQRAEEQALAALKQMYAWKPPDYTPQEDVFKALVRGGYEHYAVYGGRGSTKSWGAADALVELASTGKERIAAAREYMKRIKESSKELLENRIKASRWARDWETTDYELRNTRTGSTIFFIGLAGHNAESVGKSLEAITLLWVDEAQLFSQRSIEIILPTIRASGSRFLWTWNPGEEPSPVDRLFRGPHPPERALIQCRLVEENPYLYRTRLGSELRSSFARDTKEKYRHIWRGGHLETPASAVFTDITVGYFNFAELPCKGVGPDVHELAGMDFGYGGQDPSAVVKVYLIMPEALPGFTVEAGMKPVLYIAKEDVQRGVPNHHLHAMVKEVGAQTVICDSGMPLMIRALNASGGVTAIPAVKGAGSIMAGIQKLQSCAIYIAPECTVATREFKGLRFAVEADTGKVKKPLTLVGDDHTVDAVRYAISETELVDGSLEDGGVVYI